MCRVTKEDRITREANILLATYNKRCESYFARAFGTNDASVLEVRAS